MPSFVNTVADAVIKRIHRSPFYYGRYNNTLTFSINQAYMRYAKECSEIYRKEHPGEVLGSSPFATDAGTCFHNAFPAEKAKQYSQQITEMIERKDPMILQTESDSNLQMRVQTPLKALGLGVLDVLKDPRLDLALRSFFQGYYRIESIGSSRTLPSNKLESSWLWHSDSFPPYTCKVFLHLTPANAERGATQFMNLKDTMAYRRAGYFGQFGSERYASLEEFAKDHGLQYRPYHFDAEPGDATLFNMNFFHRAIAPKHEYRDIVSFYFLPSPIPWDQHFAQYKEELMSDNKKSGFPKDPRLGAPAGAVQSMM